jgi:hypothetical protein
VATLGRPTIEVPVALDVFGRPKEVIQVADPKAAWQWDRRAWHPSPPGV